MWDAIVSVGSLAASTYLSYKKADSIEDQANKQAAEYKASAEANAEISRYDAAVNYQTAIEQSFVTKNNVAKHRRQVDAFMSTQRARIGKSGVAVDTGTPIEVAEYSLDNARRDEYIIRREGRKKTQALQSLANRYEMLAEKGLREGASYASLTMKAAEDESDMALYEGIAGALDKTYDIGETFGWWE